MAETDSADEIDQAVKRLQVGQLIGLPTETVYGLAADASNAEAVREIFRLKGRPADHPVIVHLASAAQLGDWADNSDPRITQLADAFWPGPLTLVLPKLAHVDEQLTGGQQTIAIRVPAHPVAQRVLRRFGGGVAAPSANRFGRISPTLAAHVRDEFGSDLFVVDGGDCQVGLESTILSLVAEPEILRPGAVTAAAIEQVIGEKVHLSNRLGQRASGLLDRHYSPTTPTAMVESSEINSVLQSPDYLGQKVGLLVMSACLIVVEQVLVLPQDPTGYGQQLYSGLRQLDQLKLDAIIIEQPPRNSGWLAVNDRLRRATA